MRVLKFAMVVLCAVVVAKLAWVRPTVHSAPPQSASAIQRRQVQTTQTSEALSEPLRMIAALRRVGFDDGLQGKGWHRSNFDGVWNAVLRRSFGRNEVSCLVESTTADAVERIELEAEIYDLGGLERASIVAFTQGVAAIYPTAPATLPEAIASQQVWSRDGWELSWEQYESGGYGMILHRTGRSDVSHANDAITGHE